MENIYLVGFMGCGKSTIAEKLSKEINFKHIDTDSIIEEQNSMSISEIFKNKDEKYFRNEEYKILEKILNQKRIVVSTGGGFVCRRDIMNKINKNNLSIYLKLTADNIPLIGDGTSKLTLSVSNSTIGSSASTVSPSFFNHLETVASVILSPKIGTTIFSLIIF